MGTGGGVKIRNEAKTRKNEQLKKGRRMMKGGKKKNPTATWRVTIGVKRIMTGCSAKGEEQAKGRQEGGYGGEEHCANTKIPMEVMGANKGAFRKERQKEKGRGKSGYRKTNLKIQKYEVEGAEKSKRRSKACVSEQ